MGVRFTDSLGQTCYVFLPLALVTHKCALPRLSVVKRNISTPLKPQEEVVEDMDSNKKQCRDLYRPATWVCSCPSIKNLLLWV